MTGEEPGFLEQPNGGCADPEAWPEASGSTCERSQSTGSMPMPRPESAVYPPSLIEMVKRDLNEQWEAGRQVNVESYLEVLPELGSSETIPTELILAEYQARIKSGAMADLAQFEERFPHQAKVLRELINQQEEESSAGSLLGQMDKMMGEAQHPPLSSFRKEKIRIKLPRRFGRYRVLKQLGRGAMGAVYLVYDTQLGRQVALKVPHFRSDDDSARKEVRDLDRFYREARAAATLDHPNLCPVYDVGELDGIPYLVMAYIKGRPLSRYIKRDQLIPERRVAAIVYKLALALQEAHSKGVVHRDLKPSNIMVKHRRDLIIMDFGLVWRVGGQNERLTRVGLILGTPAYMSPEQVSGKAEALGPCCDIYSLGVIMYELLTGRVPFEGPEAFVLGQILFAEPAPPSRHRPDIDARIEAICLKAMAKAPENRYATMGEFAKALAVYLRSRPDGTQPPPQVSTPEVTVPLDNVGVLKPLEESTAAPATRPQELGQVEAAGAELSIPLPEAVPLWEAWHQWTAIIEHFVLGRSRSYVNEKDYEKLYRVLVETCRVRAATADGRRKEFYERLEDLVAPWLTPKAMERADPEILFSLLCYCREAEQALRDRTQPLPRPWGRVDSVVTWPLAGVGIFACVFLGMLLVRGCLTPPDQSRGLSSDTLRSRTQDGTKGDPRARTDSGASAAVRLHSGLDEAPR